MEAKNLDPDASRLVQVRNRKPLAQSGMVREVLAPLEHPKDLIEVLLGGHQSVDVGRDEEVIVDRFVVDVLGMEQDLPAEVMDHHYFSLGFGVEDVLGNRFHGIQCFYGLGFSGVSLVG